MMRRIPVTANNDHGALIGYLMLNDTIGDKELKNSTVSWAYKMDTDEIVEMTIIPKLRIKIENDPPLRFGEKDEK